MGTITFITGGARSGKSHYAQQLAERWSSNPVYLATAHIWDEDFAARVRRHQADRDERWTTIEEEKYLSRHHLEGKTVMLDCVTLWLTNLFYNSNESIDAILEEAMQEWTRFVTQDIRLIAVSNELGMGIHPDNEIARKFADLQGWMNQYIAAMSDAVYLMIAGIPVRIKG